MSQARPLTTPKVIVTTSGKGGVGKTTSSAAIGAGLALEGYKTVVIDFDIGLRNLDLVMGCERRVIYDFINVVREEAQLQQALIRDKRLDNLYILPASQTRDKDALTQEGVERIIKTLKEVFQFDYIVCDSPAGLERGANLAMYFADTAIVVANPEVSSVRDADRMLGVLASKSQRAENNKPPMSCHLLLTRYDFARVQSGAMLSVDDVLELLRIPLLGVIPESPAVIPASNTGVPITLLDDKKLSREERIVKEAYRDAVKRLCGEDIPQRFITPEKKGFLTGYATHNIDRIMLNYLFPNKSKAAESAQVAKKRLLQVVVSQDQQHDVDLNALQKDLLKVLLQYYQHIDLDTVKVELTREEGYSILGLDVTLPDQTD